MSTTWEYSWFTTGTAAGTHDDVNAVLGWAMEKANQYGANGWELVNFQLRDGPDGVYIMGMMKRPR